jgi:tetratricopeptide (TPR) repeat protein
VFTAWPLLRRGGSARTFLALPPDAREQLLERKRQALAALRELEFEHEAGHLSDDDYADLRARYEAEAAAALTELDRIGTIEPRETPPRVSEAAVRSRSAWRHPAVLGTGAVALLLFGVALGMLVVRHTAPDPMAGVPPMGARPLAAIDAEPAPGAAGQDPATPLPPEVVSGMLQAARSALFAGQYSQAISAYQAILRRDPRNVDALTHLGLIVALGGHADEALATIDRALAVDPQYPPALLYRGQVLYEQKQDTPGAIKSWEKFLQVAPPGEDRDRVQKLVAEARARK